jgi:hypothetical protein
VIATLCFTLIIGSVSFYFISQSLYRNYISSAKENLNQSIINSSFALQTAKDTTIQISQNSNVLSAIHSDEYDPRVNPVLNTLKNTSYGIAGVTLYTLDGQIYSTSSISSHLTFEEISKHHQINQFIQSYKLNDLSMRTSYIHAIYNHVRYNEDYGMITYLVKLTNPANEIQGYLFVDINPKYMYNSFFAYDNHPYFNQVETYFYTNNDTYLKSEQNSEEHLHYTSNIEPNISKLSSDKRFLILSKPLFTEDYQVVSLVPMAPLYDKLIEVGMIFVSTIILLVLLSVLIAKRIALSITSPLSKLHQKIAHSELEINDNKEKEPNH